MRRATAVTLIVLFVLLLVATVVQLNQKAPSTPYPGPPNGTEVPSATSTPT
jgi:hypothetical protein